MFNIFRISAETCVSEGDVRLTDSESVNEGRVEICVNGHWGTVCDNKWVAARCVQPARISFGM